MLSFDEFPFDPAFFAYAKADPDTELFGDDDAAVLLPQRTAVGFVAGESAGAQQLVATLLEARVFQQRPRVILSVPDAGWRDALLEATHMTTKHIPRVDMTFATSRSGRAGEIKLLPLAGELLDHVRDECDPDFDSDYFRSLHGFGWCALDKGRVVSVAWAPALAGWAEIGVTTAASHRNRGFARAVGAAVVNEAILRNFTPHVSTDQRNAAAIAWARSLGFGDERFHDWVVLTPTK